MSKHNKIAYGIDSGIGNTVLDVTSHQNQNLPKYGIYVIDPTLDQNPNPNKSNPSRPTKECIFYTYIMK
jgi:hypothetical protein